MHLYLHRKNRELARNYVSELKGVLCAKRGFDLSDATDRLWSWQKGYPLQEQRAESDRKRMIDSEKCLQ